MTNQLSFDDLPAACRKAALPASPNQKSEIIDQQSSPDDVSRLTALLAAAGTWLTARQITDQLAWSDRKTRALAAASRGLIISGNHGYKHTRHATPEELNEFYGRMVNQGKEMIKRAITAKRTHHALVG